MNISELARTLRITPNELLEKLPEMGFDVGRRAIKIDNRTANKIIKGWPIFARQMEEKKKQEEEKAQAERKESGIKKEVKIPNIITVRDFAALAQVPVSKVLAELMKNSIFASLNERIDFDTAAIIGADLGLDIKLNEELTEEGGEEKNKLKEILGKEKEEEMILRPPVIVVMGHVDHGKTKLLDSIRQTNVVAGEAGGITQHIGAYQVTRKNRVMTFIDTPGHEAFTAMRSRGAKVADIAILVVAADDGVKPQTIEAFNIIKASNVPFVVAINKIDKEEADINRTKQDLSSKLNIVPDDWGGKTSCTPVSALKGKGIDDLLDILLLTADMEAENIKANPEATATGTIVESRVDKGEGPVATILIQNGTLRVGDSLVFNNTNYGKVRALKNYLGESVAMAGPSTPVKIIGLKVAPQVGDVLEVGEGERLKMKNVKPGGQYKAVKQETGEDENIPKYNIIIKSDVLGSAEAIEESLEKINTKEVKVKIVYKGLGNITEGDIARAEAGNAEIIGFNVNLPTQIEELARTKNITIKKYNIIYDLINYVRGKMEELIVPEIVRVNLGRVKIAAIFRTEAKSQIVGGKILDGRAEKDSLVEVVRDKNIISQGKITKLQSGKEEVPYLEENNDCGMQYEGSPVIEEGDILKLYKEEKVVKKI